MTTTEQDKTMRERGDAKTPGSGESETGRVGDSEPRTQNPEPVGAPAMRPSAGPSTQHSSLIGWFWSGAAFLFLLACSLLLFRNALVEGQMYFRSDTILYYFPMADRLADFLREGRLLLWTPDLFGGFPLFADGEGGMLYPPNLIAYLLLPETEAVTWLRIVRYFMGAAFTYVFLRTLRLGPAASAVGGLSFAFGSFMVGQMAHTNVGNTTIWLPLTLTMVELALRNVRRKRWIYATGAGAVMGLQALGLHIQPLILSGFFLAMYLPFRVLLCPITWPDGRRQDGESGGRGEWVTWGVGVGEAAVHRTVLVMLLLGLIPAIAFGIAAVQVVPLVELGLFSFRGQGVNYQFSTSYSLPVQNLVNLIFPYFFRFTGPQYYWSLWSEWEVTLYSGVAPLILATIAIVFARRRMVVFFALVAGVTVLLAFGGYSPVPLWDQLRALPGFSSLRVPARFTMLTNFSIAVLAAFGTDWLCRNLRPENGHAEGRWLRLSRAVGINGFAIYLMALLAAIAGVVWWLISFHLWIERDPAGVKGMVQTTYLALRNERPWLTSDMVLNFLNYSLDPTNSRTAISLGLMLATFLLLFAWFAFRRLWRAWSTLLVLLVAADMLLFATDFHPTVPITQLGTPNGATRWLMAQNTDGRERVYTTPGARKTEANQLLPFRLSEVTGYSSLETKRHQEYMAKMTEYDKSFLDVYGTRFVVMMRKPTALPSFRYVAFNPSRPLLDGPSAGRNAQVTYFMNPPVRSDELALISNLRDAADVPQGAEVADIVLVDTRGERVTLTLRAGKETADWTYDRTDAVARRSHERPEVADQPWVTDSDGKRYQVNLYYGEIHLDGPRMVERVEVHFTYPRAKMRVYGMMLWENPSTAHQVLNRNRYLPRYEDDEVAIMENPSALPRTYLVPAARVLKPADILETMAHGDFDPLRAALLEAPQKGGLLGDGGGVDARAVEQWLAGAPNAAFAKSEIVSYQSNEVVVRSSSDRNALLFLGDSYYPGWKALVDGREAPIYRADYLFRAVPVPAGDHEVRFVFQPESFVLGESITVFTLSCLFILWAGLLIGPKVWDVVRPRA